jgi:cysteine desulfurase
MPGLGTVQSLGNSATVDPTWGALEALDAPPRINLDANANAAPTVAVKAAVMAALGQGANPSSAHGAGEDARRLLETARDAVCLLCEGLYPEDVVFTSGCTEANNLVAASARAAGAALITTVVEHPSMLRPAEALRAAGGRVVLLAVGPDGRIDLDALRRLLKAEAGPTWVSVQAANSETGVLQPLEEIAALCAEHGNVLFHSDAAQAFGKAMLRLGGGRGPDVASLSGHKLHAPMGVGALILAEGEGRLSAQLLGGDQERGLRAGTQSAPLIAGLGEACRTRAVSLAADVAHMARLRDHLEYALRAALPSIVVHGEGAPRLPNTSNMRFPRVDAMALVAQLDAEGVLTSQGSACHSRRPEPSPVLMAMGCSEAEAYSAVRFSVSPLNTQDEIEASVAIIVSACHRLGIRP